MSVVDATGPLHIKNVPEIPGLDRVCGPLLPLGGLARRPASSRGKRIGVVGNGSTGVQMMAPLSEVARALTMFQTDAPVDLSHREPSRTPIGSGAGRVSFPIARGMRPERSLQVDLRSLFGWRDRGRVLAPSHGEGLSRLSGDGGGSRSCDGSSRPTSNPDASAWSCRTSVLPDAREGTRVSRGGRHRAASNRTGVRTVGRDAPRARCARAGYGLPPPRVRRSRNLVGSHGQTLRRRPGQKGPRTYRSITMPGFPNYFMLVGPNSPIGNISVIDVAETQVGYVLECLEQIAAAVQDRALVPKAERRRGLPSLAAPARWRAPSG